MKERVGYFDALRVSAIIAVILLHVVITPPNSFIQDNQLWWVTVVYKAMFIWAAPIFFMLSGVLLLQKEEPSRVIYFKRLPKILLPFMFWNLIYIVFDIMQRPEHSFIGNVIHSISAPIIYHFWFIYVLIGLYVITPIIRPFVKKATYKELGGLIFLCFLVSSILPFFSKISGILVEFPLPYLQGYLGFYLLGYYLQKYPLSDRISGFIYCLCALIIPVTIALTYTFTSRSGVFDDSFLKSLSFPEILIPGALFSFFQSKRLELPQFTSRFDIGRVCLGIFFSHVAILGILEGGKLGFSLTEKITYLPLGVLLNTLVVLIVSTAPFLILESLKKMKIISLLGKFMY